MRKNTISTQAHANIALIKYWGKRNETLFLPTKSSLSISVPTLTTTTSISINTKPSDILHLNDKKAPEQAIKNISRFLDVFRKQFSIHDHFIISSQNSFPTTAGLASSASGYAALTKGLNELYDLNLPSQELSLLARRGSGSACRSINDGFVLWHKGEKDDGSDSYAEQIFPSSYWPEFCIIIAILSTQEKQICSRKGMQHTIKTSPSYWQWVNESEKRLPLMINAIKNKDLTTVGMLCEKDCLDMHQCMQEAKPSLNYWLPKTTTLIEQIKSLRKNSTPCYFTIDAGPNIKILTTKNYVSSIVQALKNFEQTVQIIAPQ